MADPVAVAILPLPGDDRPRRADRPRSGRRRRFERPGPGARLEGLAAGREVATRPEWLAGLRSAGDAARLPVGRLLSWVPARAAQGPPEAGRAARPEREIEVDVEAGRAGAQVRPDHQVGGNLEQEPRRQRGLAHPPRCPAPSVRQVQPAHRPGHADVREAALLLELLLVVEGPAVREHALLEPGDEDDRELEAFRRVEGDQRDRVGVALVGVLVGDERGLLEQPVEGVLGRQVVVARRDRPQLEEVGPAFLAVLGAVGQHRPVARRLERLVEQLGERQHADP